MTSYRFVFRGQHTYCSEAGTQTFSGMEQARWTVDVDPVDLQDSFHGSERQGRYGQMDRPLLQCSAVRGQELLPFHFEHLRVQR